MNAKANLVLNIYNRCTMWLFYKKLIEINFVLKISSFCWDSIIDCFYNINKSHIPPLSLLAKIKD